MHLPDIRIPELLAIENKVVELRAEETRKAPSFPIELIRVMENFVVNGAAKATRVFVWFLLCVIYASLRFDDALHVKRATIMWDEKALFGACWQTKVERKRRGTRFAVPNVSLADVPWLRVGFDSFTGEFDMTKDYWMAPLANRN